MSTVARLSNGFARTKAEDIPKRLLKLIGWMLRTGDPAATVDRLFVSEHVADLRLIIAFALFAVLVTLVCGIPASFVYASAFGKGSLSSQVVLSALRGFVTFYAPVLGIFGAVLAWAYQAGSARLGIVDLFACEIDTLCRVVLVVDGVPRSIEAFQRGSRGRNGTSNSVSAVRHFTSEENYFPVFENNTKDLQGLEARVVVNITAFYTYMKAVRDSTRALMDMSAGLTDEARPDKECLAPAVTKLGASTALTPSQEAARNVIYMMFLGLESGRKAIDCLVEFEPEKMERTIVILLSELEAYRFLCGQFVEEEDIRHQRLALRKPEYEKLVPDLCAIVKTSRAARPAEWEPAWHLIPELNRKYEAVVSQGARPRHVVSVA